VRLIVFHYHLLPGGVTQVITSSAIAALKYLPDVEGITLVSGENNNTENVINSIKSKLSSKIISKKRIDCLTLPELGYMSDMNNYPDPEILKKILLKNFQGDLWWVHNYHLGKNPFFTETLLNITEEFPKQKIVLQIHDFPEASRYNNLAALHKFVRKPLYPVVGNVKYVTINSRDRKYLTEAGIPEEMVFILNNPVEVLQNKGQDEDKNNYTKINEILSKTEPSYIKDAPLVIYPVRTIRRKNVLEAGLLAKCSASPVNLLPTLPGVSKSEKTYSKIVDSCFAEKIIPGAAQAGIKLQSEGITFQNIMSAGKLIISSSVQEGFGYLFINSIQWKKPLFARDLDIIKDFKNLFSTEFSHFYQTVEIPLNVKLKKQLNLEYSNKISALENFLDKNIISNLQEQRKHTLGGQSIDFSYLSVPMQKDFLCESNDQGLLNETRQINTAKLKKMEKLLSINTLTLNTSGIKKFSLTNHAEQIGNIISSFKNDKQITNISGKNINYKIVSSFTNFSSISLLYDPI